MVKEENKLGYGLKGKLISAVAMLLVAVIMVVSSTYAWFTLSTAPEVTGITTAVGANGALEMLLATKVDGQWFYGTGTVEAGEDSNTYWGNLVNLTGKKYGQEKIVLYPSVLHTTTVGNDKYIGENPLSTPIYGSDGRVSGITNNAIYGVYDSAKEAFMEAGANDYGFRGVGVASGMTPRQLAFRNARSQISTLMANARNAASDSLTNNGSTLANLAIKKAMLTAPTYSNTELKAIDAMIVDLTESLGYIEEAYMQAFYAFAASSVGGNDTEYAALKVLIDGCTTPSQVVTTLEDNGATVPEAIKSGITAYENALAAVNAAKAAFTIDTSVEGSYNWSDFSVALTKLVDMDKIQVNGIPANEVNSKKDQLVQEAFAGGIVVTIASGGGVYADIADQAKDFKVDIMVDLTDLGYAGMELPAKMNTKTSLPKVYLDAVYTYLSSDDMEPASGDAEMPLTEFYGYVIDLAFRTNAAQSNLLLQQQGIDRIYSDNNNEETLGKGSTMTFTSADNNFSNAQVRALMENIRIVFFDTEENTIYAYAKLDMAEDKVKTDADGITAYMYLYKIVDNAYKADDNTIVFGKEVTIPATDTEQEKTEMQYYTDAECTILYEGTMPEKPENVKDYEVKLLDKDAKITSLAQNTETHVSALVYLDGESIENSDVAASVAQSMTGKMNLQFASDATLVPMEYGNLHQTGTQTKTEEVAQGTTEYALESISGATWAFKGTTPEGWSIADGKVIIPDTAVAGDEAVITATVNEKVTKEITIKIVAASTEGS